MGGNGSEALEHLDDLPRVLRLAGAATEASGFAEGERTGDVRRRCGRAVAVVEGGTDALADEDARVGRRGFVGVFDQLAISSVTNESTIADDERA